MNRYCSWENKYIQLFHSLEIRIRTGSLLYKIDETLCNKPLIMAVVAFNKLRPQVLSMNAAFHQRCMVTIRTRDTWATSLT